MCGGSTQVQILVINSGEIERGCRNTTMSPTEKEWSPRSRLTSALLPHGDPFPLPSPCSCLTGFETGQGLAFLGDGQEF